MQSANGLWRGNVFNGTFIPDPALENDIYEPTVATAEEAAADKPDTDSEEEFVENSSDEADHVPGHDNEDSDEEEAVEYNLEDEVSDEEEPNILDFE